MVHYFLKCHSGDQAFNNGPLGRQLRPKLVASTAATSMERPLPPILLMGTAGVPIRMMPKPAFRALPTPLANLWTSL